MKLYLALSYAPISDLNVVRQSKAKRILSSFYVLQKFKTKLDIFKQFESFLDSGAFSAFTKKTTINLNEYIAFIKETNPLWKIYATLDVIGDWKATKINTEYMESKGLHPLPVFHYGSPIEELKSLISRYNHIALGGLVPLALHQSKLESWLDYCFSVIGNKVKVHGFGVNSIWAWKRYPFYSVDASSWSQGARYYKVISFEDSKFITESRDELLNAFKFYHKRNWKDRSWYNIATLLKAEAFITKLWQAKGIEWKD